MTTVQSSYGVAGLEQGGYSVPQGLQLGSAEGKQKGSERMTLGINKLIGPHIVAAGQTTLNTSATFTKVPVPTINDAVVTASTTTVTNYVVMFSPVTTTAATNMTSTYAVIAATVAAGTGGSSAGQVDEFTITHVSSGSSQIVNLLLVHL